MVSSLPVPDLPKPFDYETYLFDADGVLWRENKALPGAIRFIDELLKMGKRVFIVTNNSTSTTEEYVRKVERLGFGKISEKNIISPNVVMVDFFRRNPHFLAKGSIYTIASAGVVQTLQKELRVQTVGAGPDPVCPSALFLDAVDLSREVGAVVVGYDPHFSYAKIMKAANYLRDPSCGFFLTNEDTTFPGPDGVTVPGTGCITASIRACALPRQPIVFGKPGEELQRYLKTTLDLRPQKAVIFGDRLDTDISFGNQLGVATCWMRTGVHSEDDVKRAMSSKEDAHLVPAFTFSFEKFYAH